MRVKSILFNTEMVRAILDGRKTVTRRAIKLKYDNTHHEMKTDKYGTRLIEIQNDVEGETYGRNADGTTWRKIRPYIEPKPPYRKGDILYVRETWQYMYDLDGNDQIIEDTGRYTYAADGFGVSTWVNPDGTHRDGIPWRPSIHMPKEAARIFLRVTDVWAEKLQDVSNEQILQEGISEKTVKKYIGQMPEDTEEYVRLCHVLEFKNIWDSTIKKIECDRYGWNANPWVWVIEFERCEKPE